MYGSEREVKWLLENLGADEFREIVTKSRAMDEKTLNFWQLRLNERSSSERIA